MAKTYDLTDGNVPGLILRFFFPMLLTNLLQQVYSMADTMIVGKGLGDRALGAVGNLSSPGRLSGRRLGRSRRLDRLARA